MIVLYFKMLDGRQDKEKIIRVHFQESNSIR